MSNMTSPPLFSAAPSFHISVQYQKPWLPAEGSWPRASLRKQAASKCAIRYFGSAKLGRSVEEVNGGINNHKASCCHSQGVHPRNHSSLHLGHSIWPGKLQYPNGHYQG